MSYTYVRSVNRYRNNGTGRFVSRDEVLEYVEKMVGAGENKSAVLSSELSNGTISPTDYGQLLKDNLKDSYVQNMVLGRGGRAEVTPSDWGTVGSSLKPEYSAIENFVAEITARIEENNPYSESYLANRSRLYFGKARLMYERGNSAAYGLPQLPFYPADGQSECKNGCRCSWIIKKLQPGDFDCTWELRRGENCPTCKERGETFTIEKPLKIRGGVVSDDRLSKFSGALENLLSYSELNGVTYAV